MDQRSTSERNRDHPHAALARDGPRYHASGAIRTWRLAVCRDHRGGTDHIHEVWEVFLNRLRALSAFVAGHHGSLGPWGIWANILERIGLLAVGLTHREKQFLARSAPL